MYYRSVPLALTVSPSPGRDVECPLASRGLMTMSVLVLEGDHVCFSVPLGVLLGLDPAFSQGKAGYSEGVTVQAANNAKCISVSQQASS